MSQVCTVHVFLCRSPLSFQEQSVSEKLNTADVSKIYTSISVQLATHLITVLIKSCVCLFLFLFFSCIRLIWRIITP